MTEKTPEQIALERIEQAEKESALELDLSNLDLTDLPPEIGKLTNLQELNISYRASCKKICLRTAGVPAGFRMLKKTETYNLPAGIGKLTQLRELNIFRNQLKSLPAELNLLVDLKELIIGENRIGRLPKSLEKLDKI